MRKTYLAALVLLLAFLSPVASGQTRYVDFAAGSDLWDGTAKTHTSGTVGPWKSSPYMRGVVACSDNNGNHFGYSHHAGQRIIFKGGVSWPAACFQMNVTAGGSSTSVRDYYGVDMTWFTGGVWTRPKFALAGVAPSTNGGLSGSHNVVTVSGLFTEWDNIEESGMFIVGGHGSASTGYDCGLFFTAGGSGAGHLVHNIFFHDWFSSTTDIVNGWSNCAGGVGMNGSHYTVTDSVVSGQNSMDVTRGVQVNFGGCFSNSSGAQRNHCSYVGEGAPTYFGPVSDNEFDHITDAGTAQGNCTGPYSGQCTTIPPNGIHTNVLIQLFNSTAAVYNNLVHDNSTGATFLVCSISSVYNNVMWNNHTPVIDIDTGTGFCPNPASNTANVYNNTIECQAGDCVRVNTKTSTLGTLNLKNNQFIKDSGNPVCVNHSRPDCATVTNFNQSNNITNNAANATTHGYTVANKYNGDGTLTNGLGVNLTTIATGVLSALTLDTKGAPWYGGVYVPRPAGGAWAVSAYAPGASAPALSLSPNPASFGNQNVGATSVPVTITVNNTGTASEVLATPYFSLTGINPADWAVTVSGSCANGATIPVGLSCTCVLTFTPSAAGSRTATLNILGTVSGSATLNGTGLAPVLSLAPSPITFGNQNVSTTSAPITVTVSNTGTANEVLSTPYYTVTGANNLDFARTGGSCSNAISIPVGSNCTHIITFTPSAVGPRSATLTINGTASASAAISGTGTSVAVPVVQLGPRAVNFGTVNTGSISSATTFTLTNTGTAILTITSITSDNAQFPISAQLCGLTLPAGGTCTFAVRFMPLTATFYTATISVVTNASTSPDQISLTGTGFTPVVNPPPAPVRTILFLGTH